MIVRREEIFELVIPSSREVIGLIFNRYRVPSLSMVVGNDGGFWKRINGKNVECCSLVVCNSWVTSMLPPMPVNVMVLEGLMSVKRFLFLNFEADAQ